MKTIISLFVMLQCILFTVNAQSLTETLGGVETNFQIVSDSVDLKATDQFIIQRAEKNTKYRSGMTGDGGYGYGYGCGYQSFHLEFIARETYVTKVIDHKDRDYNKIVLTFYDSDDIILASQTWNRSEIDILFHSHPDNSRYFYSIDIKDVPMVLLAKTVKIDIIREVSDRAK